MRRKIVVEATKSGRTLTATFVINSPRGLTRDEVSNVLVHTARHFIASLDRIPYCDFGPERSKVNGLHS